MQLREEILELFQLLFGCSRQFPGGDVDALCNRYESLDCHSRPTLTAVGVSERTKKHKEFVRVTSDAALSPSRSHFTLAVVQVVPVSLT